MNKKGCKMQTVRSRTEDLDVEKCAKHVGGIYHLVLLASLESKKHSTREKTTAVKNMDALLMIQRSAEKAGVR